MIELANCIFNPIMFKDKSRKWRDLDFEARRLICTFLDVKALCRMDAGMTNKKDRIDWLACLSGFHSVSLSKWPHYSNSNNFSGLTFCIRRNIQLRDVKLDYIIDKEYPPDGLCPENLYFWWLCSNGYPDIAKVLVESKSIDPNLRICYKGFFSTTPLIYSCYRGFLQCVLVLLEAGANVDTANKSGWTAIMMASKEGEEQCVNALIKANASLNLRNDKGFTALMCTIQEGHYDCTKALLAAGALIDEHGLRSLLDSQCKNHHALQKLLGMK